MAATKTAVVNTRIDQNVKQQAEAILAQIGLSRAVAIDLFYRQIIAQRGLPFPLKLPDPAPGVPARDAMTDREFQAMMETADGQIRSGDVVDARAALEALLARLEE